MRLEVIVLDRTVRKFGAEFREISNRLEKFLRQKGYIEVYLINSRRMRQLNKRFRKKDYSTNVLSFRTPKGFPDNSLGEIYLDPVFIRRRKEDLGLMLIHGVLHIFGYDHEKRSDRIKMEQREEKLLSGIMR